MTTSPAPARVPARSGRQLDLLPPAPPSEPALIRVLHQALYDALEPKPDGTRHHWACRNRHVNASVTPCSDRCQFANGAALLAEDYATSHPRPRPDRRRGGGRAS